MVGERSEKEIPLKPFYRPEDTEAISYPTDLNDPGAYPYTRGSRPGAKKGAFIQRELSGEGSPSHSNAQLKFLLAQGQNGVDVIGDSPTMSWIDPDHPLAQHATGTQGASLCCLRDYRELYQDIPLEEISVSNSLPAPFAIAGLYLTAKERGLDAGKLRGSVVQFILYGEDCSYAVHLPLALRLRLTCDSIQFCSAEMPRFHPFLEDTYFISEGGIDPAEEMALGFIEIRYVVRELLRRGVSIDSFAPRIALLVNCSMDLFEEIAKIRASRRIFGRMMKEEFGAQDPRSMAVVIASHTSGLSLTAQQPFNNIARGALQALALVLSGVQAIEISAFDEAYRTPTPESHLVSLRTQQVIELEAGVTKVADPLGGSYYVESLTNRMEERILAMVSAIEAEGDAGELSENGRFRSMFVSAMERYADRLKSGERQVVGLNVHQIPEEEDVLLKDVTQRKIEPWHGRIADVRAYKRAREQAPVRASLREIAAAAGDPEQELMGPILAATQAGATLGEMVGSMRVGVNAPYDPFGKLESPL